MQVCEEDGLTEGGKLVQDAIVQYTAVSKCHECGQSIKTEDQKKKKWPVMVRAIWRCYKGEVILIPAPLLSTFLSNYSSTGSADICISYTTPLYISLSRQPCGSWAGPSRLSRPSRTSSEASFCTSTATALRLT